MTESILFEEHLGHTISLLSTCVFLFLVDSNKFLGRFFTVSITVSNHFSILLECLSIFVSHQKHTPLTLAMSLSLIPSKCARIITPINSIRFSLTAHKIRAAAVVACAVSISGVGLMLITYPPCFRIDNHDGLQEPCGSQV